MAQAFRASSVGVKTNTLTGKVPTPGCTLISVRSVVASNNAGGGTTITVTLPTGHASGDVLVMAVTVRGGTATTITTPDGWTFLTDNVVGTDIKQGTYWRVDNGSLGSSVVVTITSNKASAVCYALIGADQNAPSSSQYNAQSNLSSLTIDYGALGTWTSADGVSLLFGGMARGANTVGTATDYTDGAQSSSTGGGAASRTQTHGSHRLVDAVTTIGTKSETWTGTAATNIGSQVFIKQQSNTPSVVDGDVMLMYAYVGTSGTRPTVGTPSGWTLLSSADSGSGANLGRAYLWWKVASSEPAYYSLSWATYTGDMVAGIMAFSGMSTSQPGSAQYNVAAGAASTSHTADALGSWSSANGIDTVWYSEDGAEDSFSTPTNYTAPTPNLASTGSGHRLMFFYRLLTAVTTVGAITSTTPSSWYDIAGHAFVMEYVGGGATEEPFPFIGGGYYP